MSEMLCDGVPRDHKMVLRRGDCMELRHTEAGNAQAYEQCKAMSEAIAKAKSNTTKPT